jgi:hypothetical protein
MIDLIFNANNFPFLVAIGLMIALMGLELIFALSGGGAMSSMSDVSADVDLPDAVDVGVDAGTGHGWEGGASFVSQSLGWLHLGKLPVMILLVLALMGFGLTGLAAQFVSQIILERQMPWWLACIPATLGMIVSLRYAGLLSIRYLPRDETQVISAEALVGKEAIMVLAAATAGHPAQAKLRDRYGQTHYFMVEPRDENTQLTPGMRILVISKEGSTYKAIEHPLVSQIADTSADTPKLKEL